MPHTEKTTWEPTDSVVKNKPELSDSSKALITMKPGDVLRIIHDDMSCIITSCTLTQRAYGLKSAGWEIEWYHEKKGVAVFRRTK